MENIKIKDFLEIKHVCGDEYGYINGYGNEDGYGYGCGSEFEGGDVYGDGGGNKYKIGCEYGHGDACGHGYENGSGDGRGRGNGYGIVKFGGENVYLIDDIPTIIRCVYGDYAKGCVLKDDLTLEPCYIARCEDTFAHGETLKKAVYALHEKFFEDLSEYERIADFWRTHNRIDMYPAKDLYYWHHKLTGSCELGRKTFANNYGIDLDRDEFTVGEFIELTQNSYGGKTIKKLEEKIY